MAGLIIPPTTAPAADGSSHSFDVAVGVSSDDAEELVSGWLDTSSSDLELAVERVPQTIGLRFTGLPIPPGATITAAWIQFTVDEVSTGPADLLIRAQDAANPTTFTGTGRITSRATTAASVAWAPAPWPTVGAAGTEQRTPDLSPLIQAVVGRPDWTTGNALALILTGTGTRTAESSNGTAAPTLHLQWTTGTPTTTTTIPATTTTTTIPATTGSLRVAVIGDWGGQPARQLAVRNMIDAWGPDAVVTVGDNVYWAGGYDQIVGQFYHHYIGGYAGNYGAGSAVNRFFPALGNHDYSDGGLANYLEFFDLPGSDAASTATSGNERYYDVRIGRIHVFVVNSNPQEPDGLTPITAQGQWLQGALRGSDAEWKLVVFHHPPYTSLPGKTAAWMRWPFRDWGADLVLSGDAHVYERLHANGLDYVISGLGVNNTPLDNPTIPESRAFWSEDAPGALFIVACPGALELEFRPVGYGIVDSYTIGSGSCP